MDSCRRTPSGAPFGADSTAPARGSRAVVAHRVRTCVDGDRRLTRDRPGTLTGTGAGDSA
ncbi:hypothetical protein ACFPM0_01880 [Pseudonocardia sulfidoxydans]|uniref:hypothetical protein n=1 Tax=Pseudonocardia sulfidoxydans TaxID=54011 RepID=UPI003607430C